MDDNHATQTSTPARFNWQALAIIMAVFIMLAAPPALGYAYYEKKYQGRIYPGVRLGEMDLGGLTPAEAKARIVERVDRIKQNGVVFAYQDETKAFMPLISSLSGDVAIEAITFDPDAAVQRALAVGRQGSLWDRIRQKIALLSIGRSVAMPFAVDQDQLKGFLADNFSRFDSPAQNAGLDFKKNAQGAYSFTVTEEKSGQKLNYVKAAAALMDGLARLDSSPVEIISGPDWPDIKKEEALNIDAQAQMLLAAAPLTLKYQGQKWTVGKDALAAWLDLKRDRSKGEVVAGLDQARVREYLASKVAPAIDQAPVSGKFQIADGKVTEFQDSRDGLALDVAASAAQIERGLALEGETESELAVIALPSPARGDNVNSLGLKEIIGTGHSNFGGSPKNRRHNIATGAAAVNGTLIAPGEEFSLLKVLGKVEASTGYLPELVIKEGRTIPEYGGGLCQIGTTAFRGTVEAGLPVTARRNHSYRVSYYEPAGTDATIYDPWPDYKFKNDTKSHVLIQSRIEGDDLYFDFWGTPDGRVATHTYPVISKIVKPGPTKLIETTDLKPGEKKCTEKAHNGADAYFDYAINYPDGTKDETRFKSHYVPWREVCLIGVEKLTENTATSTPASATP